MAAVGPSASLLDTAAAQTSAAIGVRARMRAAFGYAVAAGAGAAAFGGFESSYTAWAALGAVVLLAAGLGAQWGARPSTGLAVQGAADDSLTNHVVPVWQRNVEAARAESERSMGGLLESFANVSAQLDGALGSGAESASLEFDAADQLLTRHSAEMDALKEPARAALRLKDDMARGVSEVADALGTLSTLAREVQAIGRATHLLSLNASVEAARAGAAGGGFAVVAQEVRQLAGQSREVGIQIGRRVASMQSGIRAVQRTALRHDSDDDEIVRRIDEASRSAVLAVLSSISDFTRSSRSLREAGEVVQTELEKISMSLQSQDRLSQMLNSATEDMARYIKWLNGEHDPAAAVPAQWLERLEASYTMEDMRSSHHDTVKVDRAPAVEFF